MEKIILVLTVISIFSWRSHESSLSTIQTQPTGNKTQVVVHATNQPHHCAIRGCRGNK